jgi:hypothetical protein
MKRPRQKFITQEDDYFTTNLWMLQINVRGSSIRP